MDLVDLLYRMGVALAIGLLVGAERHWRERDERGGLRTAGIRTFALTGLLGGIVAALAWQGGPVDAAGAVLFGLCFIAFSGVFGLFKWREAKAEHSFSVTTVVAGQATFVLGALAVAGDTRVAGAAGVAMTAILFSRELLHGFLARLAWVEMRSAILLLAMTFVALPLLPNHPVDELLGLNPARIWLLAIILAAVSFAGYAATKLFGVRRGRLVAGAAGGLVSSTAVAIANARASTPQHEAMSLVAGALVAGAVSFARTALLVGVLARSVGVILVPALVAGACVQTLLAFALIRRGHAGTDVEPAVGNPFELIPVLQIAALLAGVGVIGRLASERFGDAGAYVIAALSGLADVDAVSLAVASLVPATLASRSAAMAVGIAVVSNTMAKTAYGFIFGTRRYGMAFGAVSLTALVAGAGMLMLAPAWLAP